MKFVELCAPSALRGLVIAVVLARWLLLLLDALLLVSAPRHDARV